MVTSTGNDVITLFANFLSLITVAICFILKIPQILTILKVGNAKGINIIALLMELSSYTIMMSYNYRNGYAILSYLEYPIILVQEIILIVCVLYYKDMLNVSSLAGACVYFLTAASFLLGVVPLGLLAFLVPLCTPIGASSKVVQLYEILRTRNSESVSVLTWFISAFTNFTRVFTICVESMDLTLLLNFTINTFLSSSVMIAAYWFKHPKRE
ncbi:solute carrier family 66 member 3 [Diabrotica virgifera virgifera]|uniref:Solute carrier family 66 member 3 n=1 Tax=Diabrotica virgifera virgifera TaxID=50390 RepID=A0A6P7FNH1_DIAVI|nr:solute carrier family 66 member 3 [Diabrotica virgifera virgifera]